jgi:hypothetical protein
MTMSRVISSTRALARSHRIRAPLPCTCSSPPGLTFTLADGRRAFEGGSANIPVPCANGAVRRWLGRFTLIRDARGKPAAAVLVVHADGDPPMFDL